MAKKDSSVGVDLINPQAAGATAEQKDYALRKDAMLKEAQVLEKKFNIRLGAEIRVTPTGIMVVMVTYDMKGKKPMVAPPNQPRPN